MWVYIEVNVVREHYNRTIFSISEISDSLYKKVLEYNKNNRLDGFLELQFENSRYTYKKAEIKVFQVINSDELNVLKKYNIFQGEYFTTYKNLDILAILQRYITYIECEEMLDDIYGSYKLILSEKDYNYFGCCVNTIIDILYEGYIYEYAEEGKLDQIYSNLTLWKENIIMLEYLDKTEDLNSDLSSVVKDYLNLNAWIRIDLDSELKSKLSEGIDHVFSKFNIGDEVIFMNKDSLISKCVKKLKTFKLTEIIELNHPNIKPVLKFMERWEIEEVDMY